MIINNTRVRDLTMIFNLTPSSYNQNDLPKQTTRCIKNIVACLGHQQIFRLYIEKVPRQYQLNDNLHAFVLCCYQFQNYTTYQNLDLKKKDSVLKLIFRRILNYLMTIITIKFGKFQLLLHKYYTFNQLPFQKDFCLAKFTGKAIDRINLTIIAMQNRYNTVDLRRKLLKMILSLYNNKLISNKTRFNNWFNKMQSIQQLKLNLKKQKEWFFYTRQLYYEQLVPNKHFFSLVK